jgi:hypothetical protein
VSRFHSADLSLSEALFEGFCAWIPVLDEQFNAYKTSDAVEAGTDSSTVQSGIAGELLAKALIVVVNAALACKPPICSRLFLLCHHPCITRGRRKDIIWKAVTKKLEKEELNVTSILAFNPAALCQVLLGSSGLLSSNASESQAALSALETAMRVFPKQFFPQFLLVYIITLHLTRFASCS